MSQSNRYTPDNLGTSRVCEGDSGPYGYIPTAVCRHLGVESEDELVFDEAPDGGVLLRAKNGKDGGQA